MDASEHPRVVAVECSERRGAGRSVHVPDQAEERAATPGQPVAAEVADAYVDEQEAESFPASDPHADWGGAPSWL